MNNLWGSRAPSLRRPAHLHYFARIGRRAARRSEPHRILPGLRRRSRGLLPASAPWGRAPSPAPRPVAPPSSLARGASSDAWRLHLTSGPAPAARRPPSATGATTPEAAAEAASAIAVQVAVPAVCRLSSRASGEAVQPLGPAGDGAAAGMKEDGRAGRGVGAGAALPQPSAGVHGELARDPAATRRLPAARAPPGPPAVPPALRSSPSAPVPPPPSPPVPAAASPLPPARRPARAPPPAPRPPALLPGRRARFGRVTCGPTGNAAVPAAPSPCRALPGWRGRLGAPGGGRLPRGLACPRSAASPD